MSFSKRLSKSIPALFHFVFSPTVEIIRMRILNINDLLSRLNRIAIRMRTTFAMIAGEVIISMKVLSAFSSLYSPNLSLCLFFFLNSFSINEAIFFANLLIGSSWSNS